MFFCAMGQRCPFVSPLEILFPTLALYVHYSEKYKTGVRRLVTTISKVVV